MPDCDDDWKTTDWQLPTGFKVEPHWLEPSVGVAIVLHIPVGTELVEVKLEAFQVGDLAVHEASLEDNIGRITHVPTLTKFDRACSEIDSSTVDLIEWCRRVQECHKDDWTVLRGLTPKNYDSKDECVQEARLRIFNFCRGIKVGWN